MNFSEKIYGANIGALKGKTTRNRPTPVKNDLAEVPPELIEQHRELIYYMNVMYVNNMPMLTGIDRILRYRILVPLTSRVAEEIYRAVDVVFRHNNTSGFMITDINCDGEFNTLMYEVDDKLRIAMNYTSKGQHVIKAERNNCTIGERIKSTYHNLPYKIISRIML